MTFLRNLSRIELLDIAESVPNGPSTRELSRLAVENEIMIGAGLVEVGDDGEVYNTYVVTMPNGDHHSHRKLHCFISPHMRSGSQFLTFDTHQGWRIGVLTCYDCNLPENARMVALKGAHLLLAPHQTGGFYFPGRHGMGVIEQQLWDNRRNDPAAIEAEFRGEKGREWIMTWLPARAYDNGMFLVFSNGVGLDGNEIRTGNSMILDPYGRILAETDKAQDDLVVAQLDPSLLDKTYGRMFIRTRRPELYTPLTDRTLRNDIDERIVSGTTGFDPDEYKNLMRRV